MPTLYVSTLPGGMANMTPTQLNSYSTIQYAPGDTTTEVEINFTASGTVDFTTRLGTAPSWITGFSGNDVITGGTGNDLISGAGGNDILYGGLGNDALAGDDENGGLSNDILYGGAGNDLIAGQGGDDILYGGDGNDSFYIAELAPGFDQYFGGAGNDELNFGLIYDTMPEIHLSRLVLNAAASVEFTYHYILDTPLLFGTAAGDSWDLTGTGFYSWDGSSVQELAKVDLMTGADTFKGSYTSETLFLADGNDVVDMGAGNDYLVLKDGVYAGSVLNGGLGEDTLRLGDLTEVPFLVVGSISGSLFAGFEAIELGAATIQGTAGNETWDLTSAPRILTRVDTAGMGAGNDRFFGSVDSAATTVSGDAGNDTLIGNTGNDNLYGGRDNDSILGGLGNDGLAGGFGVDTIYGGLGNDTLVFNDWNGDTWFGGEGIDMLILNPGFQNNSLASAVFSTNALAYDPVRSIEAMQFFFGGRLEGTSGNDTFNLTGFTEILTETAVKLLDGDDIFRAAPNSIAVEGGTGNDTLYGGAGNDTLDGGTGNDFLSGGEGGDTYVVDSALDIVVETGVTGLDVIVTTLAQRSLTNTAIEGLVASGSGGLHGIGNALGNLLVGGQGRDWLEGREGNDTLDASFGANDTLQGGIGDDIYYNVTGTTSIVEYQGGGNDTLVAFGGTIRMAANIEVFEARGAAGVNAFGSAQANLMLGGDGNDTLNGSDGKDTLIGGGGINTLYGGVGDDTYDVIAGTADRTMEYLGNGVDTTLIHYNFASSFWTLGENIENAVMLAREGGTSASPTWTGGTLTGNKLANHILGSNGGDTIYGGLGKDTIEGLVLPGSTSGFNDHIYGGDGDDTLIYGAGGVGGVYLYGGRGNDLYDLRNATLAGSGVVFTEAAGEGRDTLWISGRETFYLYMVNSTGVSNIEDIRIDSTAGQALTVWGDDASNRITGGAGNEELSGSGGNDTLTGGAGRDTFQFYAFSAASPTDVDRVTDFKPGEDGISISGSSWNSGTLSDTNFKDLSLGAADADDYVVYNRATGELFMDRDGAGTDMGLVLLAIFNGRPAITAADIFVGF